MKRKFLTSKVVNGNQKLFSQFIMIIGNQQNFHLLYCIIIIHNQNDINSNMNSYTITM